MVEFSEDEKKRKKEKEKKRKKWNQFLLSNVFNASVVLKHFAVQRLDKVQKSLWVSCHFVNENDIRTLLSCLTFVEHFVPKYILENI